MQVLIYEYKLDATPAQYAAMDEAIRVVQFIRNKCLRLWMDGRSISSNDLQCYCSQLAKQFPFATLLNSQARQAAAERAWFAIQRFYDNCLAHKPGKKGYPQFQHDNRSVEYKQTGWKLEPDGKHLTFMDGCNIGRVRLIGTRDIEIFPVKQIKRVRLVKRADGYYCQFGVKADRTVEHVPTGRYVGIDMGLNAYTTDSEGNTVSNPRFLRKAEKRVKRLSRKQGKCAKKSNNRKKAQKQLGKAHLKVQRQREDFARKQANALITSSDVVVYEKLSIRNMVKNHHLAKSISDASWGKYLAWVKYYGGIHNVAVIAVAPHFTSQDCSACGTRIKKSLSVRTHVCHNCGMVMDRDQNAALNILDKGMMVLSGRQEPVGHASHETLLDRRSSTRVSRGTLSKPSGGKKNSPSF
jgi:putative transposase